MEPLVYGNIFVVVQITANVFVYALLLVFLVRKRDCATAMMVHAAYDIVRALLIDTGYGAGNIREYLQTLTDKPVRNVINTHSHFDHTANNGYFEKAFMAKEGLELATIPYKSFEGIDFIQDYERVTVEEGFLYDLGGRTLEMFQIPDHTVDGIALLDRKERLLFTGDEFMKMGKRLKVSLTTFFGYLEKLMGYRKEFERICAGGGVFETSFLDSFYECASYILEGHPGEPFSAPEKRSEEPRGLKNLKDPSDLKDLKERIEYDQLRGDQMGCDYIIYDRMMPHPGDSAGGTEETETDVELYVVEHAGIKIIYNRKI